MISNSLKQTPSMQKKLMVAAFATPFALAAGTGGFIHAQPVESTGNSMFVVGSPKPTKEEIDKARFVNTLNVLKSEFGLSKIQMAKLMQVSRQSIHSWLEGAFDSVKEVNQKRLNMIVVSLLEIIDEPLRPSMGALLSRRLDRNVSDFEVVISQESLSSDELQSVLRNFNFKLAGIAKSNELTSALSNKNPLI